MPKSIEDIDRQIAALKEQKKRQQAQIAQKKREGLRSCSRYGAILSHCLKRPFKRDGLLIGRRQRAIKQNRSKLKCNHRD